MTEPLFLTDPYLSETGGTVTEITEDGSVVLDRSVFYARGGGQPGDSGVITWNQSELRIVDTVRRDAKIMLQPEPDMPLPSVGQTVIQRLDWERRHRFMRVHTGLHLLSVVIPLPVTGGAITAAKGRLDFDMPEPPQDRLVLEARLKELISRDLPVMEDWITDDELAARPDLVKTMSVKPPVGAGRVRLIRIGGGDDQIDLQPCGGTHVRRTGEIGAVTIGKIEKKGARNRRVNMLLA